MSDDLLRALGRHQREALESPESSEQAEDELSRPFDEAEQAEILDGLFERLDEKPSVAAPDEPRPAAEVIPLRRWPAVALLLAAAAAALLIWWVIPKRSSKPMVATVPAYEFTKLEGGLADQRSESPDPSQTPVPVLKLQSDSEIEWVLTPAEPVRDELGVSLSARSEGGETRFVPRIDAQVSEVGAILVSGPLNRHVELSPGSWLIDLLVAEPDALPEQPGADQGPWRRLSLRVIIVESE